MSLVHDQLNEVTKNSFSTAFVEVLQCGITSIAPLGMSGDTFVLFGGKRKSQVSLRMYGNDVELLITDKEGTFIFLGRFDLDLGVDFVVDCYWKIFQSVKGKIESTMPKGETAKIAKDVALSPVFSILSKL